MKFKSSLFNAAMIATTLAVSLASTPSQAITGVVSADPVLILGGLAAGAASAFLYINGRDVRYTNPDQSYDEQTWAELLGAIGWVLLDQNQSYSMQFVPVSAEQAKALNVSADDINTYNNELDQVNAVAQTVAAQTVKDSANGMSNQEVLKQSSELWSSYENVLSPGTVRVAQAIANSAFQK